MEEKRGGWVGKVLLALLALVLVLSWAKGGKTETQNDVTIRTERNDQPDTLQFGNDAERIAGDLKSALGSGYTFSWTASGYKLTFTVKIQDLSGDDLADLYAIDAAEAQKIIDNLNESMKSANSGTLQRFKTLGYKSPSVVFSMVTSDDMEVCTVTNGKITHSITKDNFRYG